MKIVEEDLEKESEMGNSEEQLSSLPEDELYKNEVEKEILTNKDIKQNMHSKNLSNTKLTEEINNRGRELVILFSEIEQKLRKANDEYKSINENYEYFQDKAHEILTGENNTALRGQKTRVAEGKVYNGYNVIKQEYTESDEYVYFVNQQQFGKHTRPVNTRRKLKDLEPMEFLSFMGRYKDEILDVLSGYFKKQDKAERMCRLIEEYGYDENPPLPKFSVTMEIDDKEAVIGAKPRGEDAYTDGSYTTEYYLNKIKQIRFKTKEGRPWGWRDTNNENKLIIEMKMNQPDDENYLSKLGDLMNDESASRYVHNFNSSLERKTLLKIIDIQEEVETVINETLKRRKKELDKFNRFIDDFKKEFKTELMAMRL